MLIESEGHIIFRHEMTRTRKKKYGMLQIRMLRILVNISVNRTFTVNKRNEKLSELISSSSFFSFSTQ